MSSVNLMAREVAAKIVFYGPGLSGKTTSLRRIYDTVRPAHRGEMMSIATEGDRTLFFDFLPVKVERVGDCTVRLALYTVPGQVFYNATRKMVLQGADGVVFVADSQPQAFDSNRESLQNLEENLLEQGIRLERFPLVMQWNKRDIAAAMPVEELRRLLNPRGLPDFETSATNGRGVLDVLKAITRAVILDLRSKKIVPAPKSAAAPVREVMDARNAGIEDQIQQHLARAPVPTLAPRALQGQPPLGPASALAPGVLLDHARAAEAAFAAGDPEGCVLACREAVRRALSHAGEASLSEHAYLLRIDGADLFRLFNGGSTPARLDDAAFAIYVLMQVLTRLAVAGLPRTDT